MSIDYAISAVGQAGGNERLLDSGPSVQARNFEDIIDGGSNPLASIDGSRDQIKVIEEPSPLDGDSLKTTNSWNEFSSRVTNGLNDVRDFWRDIMKERPAQYESSKEGDDNSLVSMEKFLSRMRQSSFRTMMAQVGMTMATTFGSLFQKTISTLYRQQG